LPAASASRRSYAWPSGWPRRGPATWWAEEQIHREYFSGVAPTHEGDTSFEVRIASTGRTVRIPADKTVVEALAEAGIEIATSCQQGVCGTCVTRVLEGEPDHRDMYFTDDEHARSERPVHAVLFTREKSLARSGL
jgi:vanillate monooxygenase ferredoxin subunit